MAGIQEYLDLIKNAVYGREVRQAIHDGIETCYKEGKAGATDLVARSEISAVNAELTARIDEIVAPSGEAPSAAEVTDARIGADSSIYDNLGGAIRGQVRGIQNTMLDKGFNVLDFIKKSGRTHNGVTFTWNEDGSCTLTGSSTGLAFCNIFFQSNAFPPFLRAGMPVCLKMESTNPDSSVRMDVYKYTDSLGSSLWSITPTYDGDGVYNNIIPEGITGLLIRISLSSGNDVNETVRVSIIPQETMWNNPNYHNCFVYDADEAKDNGIFCITTGSSFPTPVNFPYENASGWLKVFRLGDKTSVGVLQVYYPWSSEEYDVQWRTCKRGIWNEWKKLGSGDDGGGTVIENTYNITTSPHFTTDTNGWLQPIDTESEDETGKTDMTGAIMSMLTDTGYCHLASGIYYVSGSIDMPDGSTLEGCGENTIIRLLSSVESGYCVKATKYNTIKGIRFSGGYDEVSIDVSTVGSRNGLIFVGNADGQEQPLPTVEPCMVSNCWFENFDGSAIYCHNSGSGTRQGLIVSDCYMTGCVAGINIDYKSEFHKFINVIIYKCYYCVINNGGNNMFTSCMFHGVVEFTMENSTNSAHGSVVGCTFAHADNWHRPSTKGGGIAILADNVKNGFIFTGCQIWYGSINVIGARGIAFSDCQIGGNSPEITVTGGYPAFFSNCIFHATPTLDVNDSTRFDNCYLDEDGSVISA